MKFIRRYIVKVVLDEIKRNGIIIGNRKIFNKDGALTVAEVYNGE